MSKTARTIYGLGLNEVAPLGDAFWRRVPGGWIVTETYLEERTEVQHRLHPVFVPFCHPERDQQWTTQAMKQLGRNGTPAPAPSPPSQAETPPEPTTITRPSKLNDDTTNGDTDEDPGF